MGVVLRVGRQKAFLRDGEWWSADPDLEQRLNEITQSWIEETGGPPLSSADPEREAAREISRRAGGRILLHVPANGESASRTWFRKRQYRLAFH